MTMPQRVDDDGDRRRGRRRLRTISRTWLLWALLVSGLPLLLPAVVLWDLLRRRRLAGTRVLLFGVVYLSLECALLPVLLWSWLRRRHDPAALRAATAAEQRVFAAGLLGAVTRLFSLRFVVEGDDVVAPGPVIVLVRHSSIVDTLLPTAFLTARHNMLLRFVLKRELLEDPCIDIAGHRLLNHFVRRGSDDATADLDAICALSQNLSEREGVLLYPEGTRFTAARQARAREALTGREDDRSQRSLGLQTVLPPKAGGTLAALRGAEDADVVVVAHTGLEGFALISDIWRGGMIGKTVNVGVWRVPRSTIPRDVDGQRDWLVRTWQAVDAWVLARQAVDDAQPSP